MSKAKSELKGVAIPSVNESNTKIKPSPAKLQQKPNSNGSIKTASEFSCYVRLEDIVLSLDLNSCKRLHCDLKGYHIVATKTGSNRFNLSAFNQTLSDRKDILSSPHVDSDTDTAENLSTNYVLSELARLSDLSLSDVRELIECAIDRQLKARNIELN